MRRRCEWSGVVEGLGLRRVAGLGLERVQGLGRVGVVSVVGIGLGLGMGLVLASAGCGGRKALRGGREASEGVGEARRERDVEPLVVPGQFVPGMQPDGNSVVLAGADGVIVVDTGRHPVHLEAVLAEVRRMGRPVVAIVNTHWHLDHTGGNAELRGAYPQVEIVATAAVDGAISGFFPRSKQDAEAFLASGEASEAVAQDVRLDLDAMAHPEALRPTREVKESGPMVIAGRELEVHVAARAATEADLWLYDAASRTAVVGDLVVAPLPFFDTACAEGWRTALAEVEKVPWERLVPGHGGVMTRAEFAAWRAAFDAFVECGEDAARDEGECLKRWMAAAGEAGFLAGAGGGDGEGGGGGGGGGGGEGGGAEKEAREGMEAMLAYYVRSNLRGPGRERFCGAGKNGASR